MGSSPPAGPIPVTVKDWVTRVTTENNIDLQKKIVTFLLRSYGWLLAASMAIFLLEGFGLWGFKLSETVLKFIGTATVGEIGGLLTLTIRVVFGKK